MLINLLSVFWFLSLCLGQFSALFGSVLGKFYLFDLVGVCFLVFGFFYLLASKKRSFAVPKEYFPMFGFMFIGFVSLIFGFGKFSASELAYSSFYLFRFVVYFFSGILIYNLLKQDVLSEKFLVRLVALSAVLLAVAGFLQLIFLPDFTVLDSSFGWDPHKNRLASTFFDPNFLGAYFVLCLNFFLGFRAHLKKFFVPLVLLCILCTLLTFSRSTWLMLAISIFVWGLFKYRIVLALSFILAFCTYFAVPRIQTRISGITDPADSAHFRLISWKNTLNIAKDHLILGIGYNTFRFVQKDYGYFGVDLGGHSGGGSDSSLLLVLATTGMLGFLSFIAFFINLILKSLKDVRVSRNLFLIASFSGLLVESFFINSLFYPQVLFLWGVFVALFLFNRVCKSP